MTNPDLTPFYRAVTTKTDRDGNVVLDLLTATEVFMKAAGQLGTAGRTDMWPHNMPEGLRELRQKLLREEYEEYRDEGEGNDDIIETVDGLLDIIVVAWGTLLAYVGPDRAEWAAAEVVRSNLGTLPEGIVI